MSSFFLLVPLWCLFRCLGGHVVQVLVAHMRARSDANAADDEGLRPLHMAALNGQADCCAALLAHGADSDPRDGARSCPLLPVTARYCPLLPITARHCPLLPARWGMRLPGTARVMGHDPVILRVATCRCPVSSLRAAFTPL